MQGPAALTAEQIARYCQSDKHQTQCDLYREYAPQKDAFWRYYHSPIRYTPYFNYTPEQLFDLYEQTAQHIAFLWKQDPEYKQAKAAEWGTRLAIVAGTLLVSEVLAGVLASEALGAGMLSTFQVSNGLRFSSVFIPIGSAVQQGLLYTAYASGLGAAKTAVDLVSSFMAMSALVATDFTIFSAAREALLRTGETYQNALDDIETMNSLPAAQLKMQAQPRPETLQQLMAQANTHLQRLAQEEAAVRPQRESTATMISWPDGRRMINSQGWAALQHDTQQTMAALRQEIRRQYAREGWGTDPDEAFKKKENVLHAVYALEYVLAEMADLSDGFRYRKAAKDLYEMYSTDVTRLRNRTTVEEEVRQAYQSQQARVQATRELESYMMGQVVSNK